MLNDKDTFQPALGKKRKNNETGWSIFMPRLCQAYRNEMFSMLASTAYNVYDRGSLRYWKHVLLTSWSHIHTYIHIYVLFPYRKPILPSVASALRAWVREKLCAINKELASTNGNKVGSCHDVSTIPIPRFYSFLSDRITCSVSLTYIIRLHTHTYIHIHQCRVPYRKTIPLSLASVLRVWVLNHRFDFCLSDFFLPTAALVFKIVVLIRIPSPIVCAREAVCIEHGASVSLKVGFLRGTFVTFQI
jgi:hypothetical protein